MAMEELDEFEVLWPDACHAHEPPPAPAPAPISSPVPVHPPHGSPTPRPKQRHCPASSRPVDVPGAARLRRWKGGGDEENASAVSEKIVPPHLLAASGRRRSEGEAAAATLRSGRPCKRARDLHHLRNSVLRMTGFIEG